MSIHKKALETAIAKVRSNGDVYHTDDELIKAYLTTLLDSPEMVQIVENKLVCFFEDKVHSEFPDATVVPSREHHLYKAKPIAQAVIAAIKKEAGI